MTYLKVNVDAPIQLISAGEFVSEVPWKHMSRSIENFELILGVQETVYIREEQEDFEVGKEIFYCCTLVVRTEDTWNRCRG